MSYSNGPLNFNKYHKALGGSVGGSPGPKGDKDDEGDNGEQGP